MGAFGRVVEHIYVQGCIKECLCSVFMFLLLSPPEIVLSSQWYIVYQYLAIIFFDYVTDGATANPAVSAAMVLTGSIDIAHCIAHFLGYCVAALVTHPLLSFIIAEDKLTVPPSQSFHYLDPTCNYLKIQKIDLTALFAIAPAVPCYRSTNHHGTWTPPSTIQFLL